jgi:inorganic pyrophosphatase
MAKISSNVDPNSTNLEDISDIDELVQEMVEHFFEHHKDLEAGKYIKIICWADKKTTLQIINDAIARREKADELKADGLL